MNGSSTPGRLPALSTPRRRPITPGRRDSELPSFDSPTSAKIGRLLDSAYSSRGPAALEEELPEEVAEEIAAAAVSSAAVEYEAPRVWFQRKEDREQNERFTKRVDEMVNEIKRLVRDNKADHAAQLAEWAARQARMSADMAALEAEHSTILSALEEERGEETELSNAIASLQVKQRNAEGDVARLVEKKRELERELARRQNVIAEKRQVLGIQAAKNAPELAFFENQMGISILGGAKDVLRFVFTHISLPEPERPFSIAVDLSQREYRVTECSPALADLQAHVDRLNTNRDFFGFLKRIRRAFADHYLDSTI
ncbi:kinetochore-associated Ndc80 complex subunit spc25 [Coemansia javaensis]|uniref:Kinetochore protein SPC25 n=1 Tax=Coemansia javaensis TaxID=2761396 RepID=A0A9W8H970_9FUNG|nr:kinetochore-associated Ndc80 complex subunit spc25 [Coemansia javaensis]